MSAGTDLAQHLEAYLAIRDALGLAAGARTSPPHSFLSSSREVTPSGAQVRAATALAWACDRAPARCGTRARRVG